jgi:galacturan 1,4-alpha-galacturonidase
MLLTMVQDGARIKVWPGVSSALSTDLQGGGGSGLVKNVTYDGITIDNVDYAIEVTQCYGQKNLTLCNEYPVCTRNQSHKRSSVKSLTHFKFMQSNLVIEDVYFKNFKGITSGKYDPIVGTIVCSSPDVSTI